MKITNRLPEILTARNMTQKELAELANLTPATISRFRKQDRFDITTLFAISRALGVSIEDLFEVTDDK